MTPVFADTFYWYGLSNADDQWHRLNLQARKSIGKRPIVTTGEVLVEFANSMSGDQFLRAAAKALIDWALTNRNVTVIPQTQDSFLAGLELYSSRPDKTYSLVDCISMNCCQARGITEVLTNDHHFEQEGFSILIKR